MKRSRMYVDFGLLLVVLMVVALAWGGCGPVDPNFGGNQNTSDQVDDDGDGFSETAGDCDDNDPSIHPNAVEVVDGVDNNCDGLIDDDLDGDGFGMVNGDCNDGDPAINPMAREDCYDNIDNNCNGLIDAEETDQDGDGFGPCDVHPDCNDNNILIGPASIEDPTDGIDNDCDGGIDEEEVGCDCGGEPGGEPMEQQMLKAMGLCNSAIIQSATLSGDPVAYGVYDTWGAIVPRLSTQPDDGLPTQNCKWAYLSSGVALDPDPQGSWDSDLGISEADPAPTSGQDGADIHDLTQFIVTLRVPINVTGFSFDFIFFSSEYPEWVCSQFNDTFYALVDNEPQLNGGQRTNISFDNQQNEITVNNGFFEPAPTWSVSITGTGYELSESMPMCGLGDGVPGCTVPNPCPAFQGSTTGWLRTTSPLSPGEDVTLTFSVHDEGDGVLDSAVVIDNFRWQTVPIDGPGTVK